MIPGKKYTSEEVLQVAWRRKWMIAVPAVVVAAATALVSSQLPNRYRSQTLILVVPQRVPEAYVKSTVTTRIEDRLQSISQQILSRTRLERIIQDFNLYTRERQTELMEDIVAQMRSDIDLQIVKGDAFQLSYILDQPRTAMKVTERLAALFIEENLRDREILAEGTNQFLESQVEDARGRLAVHESKLEDFRRRYSGELPSQLESNLQSMQNVQMQVQALVESVNRDRDRRLVLQRLIADATAPENAVVPPPAADVDGIALGSGPAASQLEAARNALRALSLQMTAEHPNIIRLQRIIRDLEKKAEAEALERPLSADPRAGAVLPAEMARRNRIRDMEAAIEEIDRQIAHKQEEERRLRGVIVTYQTRVEATPTRESELTALTRDYDTLQQMYRELLAKKEDSQVAANLERRQIGEQFRILDPARLPEKPFSPNRVRLNLFGILIGLGVGAGLAALLEARDQSLRSDDDVMAAVSLPVLATIPFVMTADERRRRCVVVTSAAGMAAALLLIAAAAVWKWELVKQWIG